MRAAIALVFIALTAFAVFGLTNRGQDADATGVNGASPAADCGPVEFDRYDAGAAIEGIAKSDTARMCEPDVGAPTRINKSVTFYGSCMPASSDGGCAPPLQIASWPACERNLALYEKYPAPDGTTEPYTRTTIRGVPAAIFDGGQQIEVYTAATTIVIFSEEPRLTRAAASRLSGTHAGRLVRQTDELPAPVKGALAGDLAC
jgi:hypothetical protein